MKPNNNNKNTKMDYSYIFKVNKSDELLTFLLSKINTSRNNVKSLLTNRQILVNGSLVTQYNFMLAKDDEIKISINGQYKTFDQMPVIIEGRTLVPMRAIFEALGATVGWDDATKTATGKTASTEVSLTIDKKDAKVNGATKTLDVPAKIIEGRFVVPVRSEHKGEIKGIVHDTSSTGSTLFIAVSNFSESNVKSSL